ncbi:MAG: hypothetical protein ACLP2P_16155 [Desulfobaccales bacterium]
MCIFCGGQCGGLGEFLISLGLPFLALYFSRIKKALGKMKNKILRRDLAGALDEPITCQCCGEALQDCRGISSQSLDRENLDQLELKFQDNESAEILISTETTNINNQIKLETETGLKGVKGWLLLLCLNLTIFIPASYLYQFNCILDLYNSTRNKILLLMFKKLLLFNIATGATMLFLAIFSFYVGMKLWNIKSGAVRIGKAFLIIQLFLIFIITIIRPFMTFSSEPKGTIFGAILLSLIPSLFQFGLWYLYLSKSSRVYNTYRGTEEKRSSIMPPPTKLDSYTELSQG